MKTNELKKVVIALDYDPTAKKVAETGYLLAKNLGAEVVLLHVIADPVYYSSPEYSPIMGLTGEMGTNPMQLDNIEGLLEVSRNFLEKLKHHLGDETINIVVKEGDFAETILKSAREMHADIIVMGSHSKKWLEKIVMGSVTENVLNETLIPMFIVPTKKRS